MEEGEEVSLYLLFVVAFRRRTRSRDGIEVVVS